MRSTRRFPVGVAALVLVATLLAGTPASGAIRTLTFGAAADTTVRADKPARSYGAATSLTVDNSPVEHTLLRFTVSGVGTDVVSAASLRLYVTNASPAQGTVFRVASQTWAENVTWTTAPAADATPIASPTGKAIVGTWVTYNLASLVPGDGTYSVRITSNANDGVDFASRESTTASQRPQIVVSVVPPPDATPPTVAVSSPAGGATLASQVTVEASAQDDTAVTAVDVAIDGSVVGTDTTAPYAVVWDTLFAANGPHTITAVAHDAIGHATTSTPVAVTVANATDASPPSSPADLLATVDGPRKVTLSWTASTDDVAVASYEVQRDNVVLAGVVVPGYVDTGVPQGSTVTYTVTAIDPSGNRSEPASASATTPTAPTSFTFAAAGDHGANAKSAASLAALDASPAAFYLALGDMDYDQTLTDAAWCDYVHAGLPTKGPAFPIEVETGNHEDDFGPNGSILNHAACLQDRLGADAGPGASYGTEYAFDYPAGAPLARFIMISPELTVAGTKYHYVPGNPHYDWLASKIDAAHAAGIRWVIVGMHFPCLSAGQYTCAAGPQLMNLLVSKHVDLILHGHEHTYQRSKQLALDPATCPSIPGSGYVAGCVIDDGLDGVYPKGAGSVDVIAGTFGQGLYNTYPADPESPYFVRLDASSHGFMQYAVTADRIDAAFTKIDGTLQDSFSIVAGAAPSADRAAPSQPTALAASTATPGRVDLSWTASTDDTAIRDYAIFRDGLYVASTAATTFSDPSVTSLLTYTYAVSAYDAAGNPSPMSQPVQVTVPQAATLTFGPDADASLYAGSPTTNYGASVKLETDNSPVKQYLIRFTVSGVGTRTVTGATLRLSCIDSSPSGGVFTVAASNDWIESTVNYTTAPASGATVATLGKVVAGTNYVVDLSSLVHGDGTYTLRILTANADGADFASKEGAIGSRPQLTVTTS